MVNYFPRHEWRLVLVKYSDISICSFNRQIMPTLPSRFHAASLEDQ
nr:MAG TPA: hypothetical protein [Caudoviricetes sp.]